MLNAEGNPEIAVPQWTTLKMFESPPPTPFHAVSYHEQELALRVVQGLCVLIPGQRRVAADGALIPVVLDSFLAFSIFSPLFSKGRRTFGVCGVSFFFPVLKKSSFHLFFQKEGELLVFVAFRSSFLF